MFYGNGTARDVRNSPWRDRGLGVIPDLASHMLDLCLFWFGRPAGEPQVWTTQRYENAAYDYFLMGFPDSSPMLKLEGTLMSWRNTFGLDLIGERGSIHVTGLCKWGPSSLIVRDRVLPSGRRTPFLRPGGTSQAPGAACFIFIHNGDNTLRKTADVQLGYGQHSICNYYYYFYVSQFTV